MQKGNYWFLGLIVSTLIAGCGSTGNSSAGNSTPASVVGRSRDLLSSAPAVASKSAGGAYSRARVMTLDPTVLPREQGDSVRAALFDDLVMTFDLEAPVSNPDGSEVWTGHVVGQPMSHVTLVHYQDVVSGSVVAAQGAFELLWKGDNHVQVAQRDPQTRGDCGGAPENVHARGGVQPKVSGARAAAVSNIDVYVVYNQAVLDKLGSQAAVQAKLVEQITESNKAFTNSQVDVKLNLVGSEMVAYTQSSARTVTGADLEELTLGKAFEAARNKRAQNGADLYKLVLTVSPEPGSTFTSGIAWLPSKAFPLSVDSSYSVTALEGFDNGTFAHEIGHNFGCNHDVTASNPPVEPERALLPFGYGLRKPGVFATLMAYAQSGEQKIPFFSNPNVSFQGDPTGVAGLTENWRVLNSSAPTIAAYATAGSQPTPTPTPPTNLVTVSLNTGWNALAMQREVLTSLNSPPAVAGLSFLNGTTYETRPFNIDEINKGAGADGTRRGMFVFATAPSQFSYSGQDDSQGNFVNLSNGWNLSAFVSPVDVPASKLAARQGNVSVPIGSVVLPLFQEIQPDNTYKTVDITAPGATLKAGRAYWVFSLGNVLLTF